MSMLIYLGLHLRVGLTQLFLDVESSPGDQEPAGLFEWEFS